MTDKCKLLKTAPTVILLLFFIGACRRHDYRIITIDVPGMKNRQCVEIVTQAIVNELMRCMAFEPDKKIQVDMTRRTVTVTYDSLKLSVKNIEFAIAKAGFAANDVPADHAAYEKLPPECK